MSQGPSNILLVVDTSAASVAAAKYALNLARRNRTPLTSVYVADPVLIACPQIFPELPIFNRLETDSAGLRYLNYVAALARELSVDMKPILLNGNFHREVLRLAYSLRPELLVIGGWEKSIRLNDYLSHERELIASSSRFPVVIVNRET